MKSKLGILLAVISINLWANPNFNGASSGCSGGGCHSFSNGILTATTLDNFQVSIYLPSVNTGEKVAGELVDANGNVVTYNNETHSNPFILTAPGNGNYTVFAGYDEPSRLWDSAEITFEAVGVDQTSSEPKQFRVFPNYPNPFNPSTRITYSLPREQATRVAVYDVSGEQVALLAAGIQSAGDHALMWDGKDQRGYSVNAGVFILRITSGSQSLSRKMLLLP